MSARLDNVTSYRQITESDLEQIIAIENVVHAHPWSRGNFADSLGAGYQCWLAERDGRLVGYGILTVAADEAHLLNISVAPTWQRHGVGTELTAFLSKVARDLAATKIYLEVRPSNAAARALYLRSGFVEIGMRRDYYPTANGREDAVVMELQLQ